MSPGSDPEQRVRVYSRQGCHLCEVLIEQLLPLLRGKAGLEVCDVDSRADWQDRFGRDVPVVEVNGQQICVHELDRVAVLNALDSSAGKRPARV